MGLKTSIMIFIGGFLHLLIQIGLDIMTWRDPETWKYLIELLIVVITMVIVSVPEGLPLSVAISLAYSVKRMKND